MGPVACWPASLVYLVSSRTLNKPVLDNKVDSTWEMIAEVSFDFPMHYRRSGPRARAPTHMSARAHARVRAHTHTCIKVGPSMNCSTLHDHQTFLHKHHSRLSLFSPHVGPFES